MSKFLDIGCGSGLACAIAADRGARIFGLDASPGLLEIARRRVPKGDFGTADMESLPWRDRRFDVITFFNSIFFADLSAKIFACTMELRKHPKMTWQGSPNWPPQWHRPYGPDKPLPEGEIGFFKAVDKSSVSDLAAYGNT